MAKRGFVIYAHNNDEVDYGLIAFVCGTLIKHHLRENAICLVTDTGTYSWLIEQRTRDAVADVFDVIHMVEAPSRSGTRLFRDSASTTKTLPWHNASRPSAYDISPFDETILLDSDYLVMDRALDAAWGLAEPVAIPTQIVSLDGQPTHPDDLTMGPTGLPLRWATMVYFRKSREAEMFFQNVAHVQKLWQFHAMSYGFSPALYRNDYAFTIAAHLLDGGGPVGSLVPPLPGPGLVTTSDSDELIDAPSEGCLRFLLNDRKERWQYRAAMTRGLSVHVQNKFSIVRNADAILRHHPLRVTDVAA